MKSLLKRGALLPLLRFVTSAMMLVFILSIGSQNVNAANRYWTNGAGNNLWSDASNWSGGLPGTGDRAIFNDSSFADCTIDVPINVRGITIEATYGSTVTVASGNSVTIGTQSIIMYNGTFNGGDQFIDIANHILLYAGTFTCTSDTLFLGRNLTISAGATFNHSNGTVVFDGGSTGTFNVDAAQTLYNVVCEKTNRLTVSGSDTMKIENSIVLNDNVINTGYVYLESGATISVGSGFDGGNADLVIDKAITLTISSTNFMGIILDHASAIVNATTDLQIGGVFDLKQGTFNGGTGKITLNNNVTLGASVTFNATTDTTEFLRSFTNTDGGVFNHNNGTVALTGTANATFNFDESETFYNFVLNKATSSDRLVVSGTDTLFAENSMALIAGFVNTGYLQTNGSLTIGNSFSGGNADLIINAAATVNLPDGAEMCGVILDHASAVVNCPAGGSVTFEGVITINNGTFNGSSAKLDIDQVLTINGGTFTAPSDTLFYGHTPLTIDPSATFNHNNGTVVFDRVNNTTINASGTPEFYNVVQDMNHASTSKSRLTITSGQTIVVLNDLALIDGQLQTGTLEARGQIVNGSAYEGGTAIVHITNGGGPRTIELAYSAFPTLIMDDADAELLLPTTTSFDLADATLIAGSIVPDIYPITISGTYTQSGGVFYDGEGKISVTGNFYLNGGSFISTTDTLEVTGTVFNVGTGAWFGNNSGTVSFKNASNSIAMDVDDTITLYNVYIDLPNTNNNRNNLAITSGDTIIVENQLALVNGDINTGVVELQGNIDNLGTFDGGTGIILLANGTGPRTLNLSAGDNVPDLIITDPNVTFNAPASGTVNIEGDLIMETGTFNGSGSTINVNGDFDQDGGVYNAGSGAIVITGDILLDGGTFVGNGDITADDMFLNAGTFSTGSGTVTLGDDLIVNGTDITQGTGDMIIGGLVTFSSGNFTGSTGQVDITASFTQTDGSFEFGDGDVSIGGATNISGGGTTFRATSGNMTLGGNLTYTSDISFDHNDGTITFSAGGNRTIFLDAGNIELNNVVINLTGQTDLRPQRPLDLAGDLTIGADAQLNLNTYDQDVFIGGDYTNNNAAGLIEANQTITFDGGTAQQLNGVAEETFYGLTISNTLGGVTLGTDVHVNNLMTLTAATNAKVIIADNNLTIDQNASISGGGSNEFIVTNGTGQVRQEDIGATGRSGAVLFPIGVSESLYNPITITNTGTDDRFSIDVKPYIYSDGTSGWQLSTNALDLTWYIDEQTVGGSNVDMTYQWAESQEMLGFNRDQMYLVHYDGADWENVGTPTAAGGSDPYTFTATGRSDFSPHGGGSGGGALPIELLTFDAEMTDGKVVVSWSTATEIDNDFYTIERSKDGITFEEVGTLDGAGNTTELMNYEYTDVSPMTGISYYRLKQTDFNGDFEYFDAVAVELEIVEQEVNIYPNPVVGSNMTIDLDDCITGENVQITISDMTGRTVQSNTFNCSETNGRINMQLKEHLPPGIYHLKGQAANNSYQQRFLVN